MSTQSVQSRAPVELEGKCQVEGCDQTVALTAAQSHLWKFLQTVINTDKSDKMNREMEKKITPKEELGELVWHFQNTE